MEERYLRLGHLKFDHNITMMDFLSRLLEDIKNNDELEIEKEELSKCSSSFFAEISYYSSTGSKVTIFTLDSVIEENKKRKKEDWKGNFLYLKEYYESSRNNSIYVAVSDIVYNDDLNPALNRCSLSIDELMDMAKKIIKDCSYAGVKFRKPIFI